VPLEINGATYSLIDPASTTTLDLPSLDHFWADRNWRKKIAKFERGTGKFLWAAGRRAPSRANAGEMYNPFGLSFSHDTLFAADVLGMVWAWSADGLYLGRLLHDAEPGRVWDEYAIHVEIQGPVTMFTNTASRKLYMVVNDTGAHVYEVTLPTLEQLPPLSVNLAPETAARARTWDPDASIPVAGSVLSAMNGGDDVTLSWHTNAGLFTLQSASTATGTWSAVTAPRVTNGATISVNVPRSSVRRFYRLMK
jgi:hypothetical protein